MRIWCCVETGIQGNVTTLKDGVATSLIATPHFCHNECWFVGIKNSLLTVYLFKENISKQQCQFEVVKLPFWRPSPYLGPANQEWRKPWSRTIGGLKKKRHILPTYVSGVTMVSSWHQTLAKGTSEMAWRPVGSGSWKFELLCISRNLVQTKKEY